MIRRKTEPPRGVLKTAAAEPSRYHHARYHPSPELETFVEHYPEIKDVVIVKKAEPVAVARRLS